MTKRRNNRNEAKLYIKEMSSAAFPRRIKANGCRPFFVEVGSDKNQTKVNNFT